MTASSSSSPSPPQSSSPLPAPSASLSSSPSPSLVTSLRLHQLVFQDDVEGLRSALLNGEPSSGKHYALNCPDKYGNTPLLLAVQLGRSRCVELLLEEGKETKEAEKKEPAEAQAVRESALIRCRNKAGWNVLQEAVSLGDRAMLRLLWQSYKERSEEAFRRRLPLIMSRIQQVPDFQLVIDWKFSSWVPFLGRVLPSDTYHISKKGPNIRIDTSLKGFSNLSYVRGSISFLLQLGEPPEESNSQEDAEERSFSKDNLVKIVALDNDKKIFSVVGKRKRELERKRRQKLAKDKQKEKETGEGEQGEQEETTAEAKEQLLDQETEGEKAHSFGTDSEDDSEFDELEEMENELDDLQSAPITDISNPGRFEFTRLKSGFWPWRSDKVEDIHGFSSRVFKVGNINLLNRKRLEHLSEEQKKKTGQLSQLLTNHQEMEKVMHEEEEKARKKRNRRRRRKGLPLEPPPHRESGEIPSEQGEQEEEEPHHSNLPHPPPPSLSYDEYFHNNSASDELPLGEGAVDEAEPDELSQMQQQHAGEEEEAGDEHPQLVSSSSESSLPSVPRLGRPIELREEKKRYSATVWLTDNFPLTTETVCSILEMAAPQQRHVRRLRNFMLKKMPPGFPVKLTMPIFPTVTATVTFVDYKAGGVEDELFTVPQDYKEVDRFLDSLMEN